MPKAIDPYFFPLIHRRHEKVGFAKGREVGYYFLTRQSRLVNDETKGRK